MEFFSTLIWTPRNTFSETAVAVKNATRLKLKWVPSCCGLKQAEATSITTKEPFVPGTERWKLISPARGIHWDSVGRGGEGSGRSPHSELSNTSVPGTMWQCSVPPLWAQFQVLAVNRVVLMACPRTHLVSLLSFVQTLGAALYGWRKQLHKVLNLHQRIKVAGEADTQLSKLWGSAVTAWEKTSTVNGWLRGRGSGNHCRGASFCPANS